MAAVAQPYSHGVPYLTVRGAERALEFYAAAFAAVEVVRIARHDGKVAHAELKVGEAVIMLREEYPQAGFLSPAALGGTPVNLLIYVADTRATTAAAVAAGATLVRGPEMQFHGDLMSELADPFGHSWFIATREQEMDAAALKRAASAAGI